MRTLVALLALFAAVQDQAVERAKKTLERSPNDPAANLVMGVFHADKAKWDLALDHLGKVKSPDIRAAVEAEKKQDGNKFTMVEIGDIWAKAIAKAGPARQACFDRMNFHYAAAWETLDLFGRDRLRERLARLYAPLAPPKGAELPKGWGGPVDLRSKAAVSSKRVRSGSGALLLTPTYAGLASIVRVETSVVSGKSLEFSGWISSEGTDTTQDKISFTVLDKNRKPLGGKTFHFQPDSFVWSRVGDEMALPDGPVSVYIEILLGSLKGVAWVDDLSVKVDGREILHGGGFE